MWRRSGCCAQTRRSPGCRMRACRHCLRSDCFAGRSPARSRRSARPRLARPTPILVSPVTKRRPPHAHSGFPGDETPAARRPVFPRGRNNCGEQQSGCRGAPGWRRLAGGRSGRPSVTGASVETGSQPPTGFITGESGTGAKQQVNGVRRPFRRVVVPPLRVNGTQAVTPPPYGVSHGTQRRNVHLPLVRHQLPPPQPHRPQTPLLHRHLPPTRLRTPTPRRPLPRPPLPRRGAGEEP
jgi:hypothetical protein